MRVPELRELLPITYAGASAYLAVALLKTLSLQQFLLLLDRWLFFLPRYEPELYACIAIAVTRRTLRLGVGECLLRSVLLYRMLKAARYMPVLVIGVNLNEGVLHSHGWIELSGEPLCEQQDPRLLYQTMLRHEAS